MRIQVISEGSTDREILRAIVIKIRGESIDLLEESKTQRTHRGKQSLLSNYKLFVKFLHNAYYRNSDLIIICVDNDGEALDEFGIGSRKKKILKDNIELFVDNNSYNYPDRRPGYILAVPVQTIDYWMKCIDLNYKECHKIRDIEKIPKEMIKIETYGKKNVHLGWQIDQMAFNNKIDKLTRDQSAIDKLSCLPSFKDFMDQFKEACDNLKCA